MGLAMAKSMPVCHVKLMWDVIRVHLRLWADLLISLLEKLRRLLIYLLTLSGRKAI